MNNNQTGAAPWIECRVVFDATRDGRRVNSIEITGARANFDRSKDLGEQARAAVAEWDSRKERIYGHRYHDALITYIEVRTSDGRYLDATTLGWAALDHALRRKAIEKAGYRI
jgi:hypothetical protein